MIIHIGATCTRAHARHRLAGRPVGRSTGRCAPHHHRIIINFYGRSSPFFFTTGFCCCCRSFFFVFFFSPAGFDLDAEPPKFDTKQSAANRATRIAARAGRAWRRRKSAMHLQCGAHIGVQVRRRISPAQRVRCRTVRCVAYPACRETGRGCGRVRALIAGALAVVGVDREHIVGRLWIF